MDSQVSGIIQVLQNKDFKKANELIHQLNSINPSSALPHLYWGILEELKGFPTQAMRHYRASIALDGTCKASLHNLFRCGDGKSQPIDFGKDD